MYNGVFQVNHSSIQIIHDEHTTLASMLRSIGMMVARGPNNNRQNDFDVMRSMVFYIDEFPERLHHPKESELLFPGWYCWHLKPLR